MCGICQCAPDFFGRRCECDAENLSFHGDLEAGCRPDNTTTTLCNNRGDCICGKCKNCKDGATGKYCQKSLDKPLENQIIPCMKNKFFADGLTAEERAKNKKECDNITGDKGWFGENYHTLCTNLKEYSRQHLRAKTSRRDYFISMSLFHIIDEYI